MECTPLKSYRCSICDKSYSSRQSLWNHNTKFHTNNVTSNVTICNKNATQLKINVTTCNKNVTLSENIKEIPNKHSNLLCIKCNIQFNNRQTKWRHDKKCIKIITDNIDNKLKEEIRGKLREEMREEMKEEMAAMKKQLLIIMNKQCKIHPKTLQKINNTLNNNNLNNSCNTTNNIINIVQLGNENLETVFSKNKQIEILKQRFGCLPYLIRETHLNDKYPQFKNILITNLMNNIAYKYDKITKNFIAVDKTELLNEVVSMRMDDIESFFESNTDVLDEKTKSCVEQFISKMDSREGTYYNDKMKDVKLMIYNNRDKVSKELIQTLEIIV